MFEYFYFQFGRFSLFFLIWRENLFWWRRHLDFKMKREEDWLARGQLATLLSPSFIYFNYLLFFFFTASCLILTFITNRIMRKKAKFILCKKELGYLRSKYLTFLVIILFSVISLFLFLSILIFISRKKNKKYNK